MPTRAGPARFDSIDACLAAIEPARAAVARDARRAILDSDASIGEVVMWNAPTFVVDGAPLATLHLRGRDAVTVVLHRGAKRNAGPSTIGDPQGLLEWRSADRALLALRDAGDLERKRDGLQSIVRDWIAGASA